MQGRVKKQYAMAFYYILKTYFFITADLGGGEKWQSCVYYTLIQVRNRAWDSDYVVRVISNALEVLMNSLILIWARIWAVI